MVASCLRDDDSADSDADLDDPTLLVCQIVCVSFICHCQLSIDFSAQFAYSTVDPVFYYNFYMELVSKRNIQFRDGINGSVNIEIISHQYIAIIDYNKYGRMTFTDDLSVSYKTLRFRCMHNLDTHINM